MIKDINFEIGKGMFGALLGKNGAGKTTIIKSITSAIGHDSGMVYFEGNSEIRHTLGYVPGDFPFPLEYKLKRIHRMYRNVFDTWQEETFQNYIKEFDIPEDKKFKEYSMGTQQKLLLALALSVGAKLLIFDEPTDGLDPFFRLELLEHLRTYQYNNEATILVSTHDVSELDSIVDTVIYVENGMIRNQLYITEINETYGSIESYLRDQVKSDSNG